MELFGRLYRMVERNPGHKGAYYASKLGDVTRTEVNRYSTQIAVSIIHRKPTAPRMASRRETSTCADVNATMEGR